MYVEQNYIKKEVLRNTKIVPNHKNLKNSNKAALAIHIEDYSYNFKFKQKITKKIYSKNS